MTTERNEINSAEWRKKNLSKNAELDSSDNKLNMPVIDESVFDKAVSYVQESYCDIHLNTPYMLLGDVAELIKITTGKEVDWELLAKYTR